MNQQAETGVFSDQVAHEDGRAAFLELQKLTPWLIARTEDQPHQPASSQH